MVELHVANVVVAGSNPVIRSTTTREEVMLTFVGWSLFLGFSGMVGYAMFAD